MYGRVSWWGSGMHVGVTGEFRGGSEADVLGSTSHSEGVIDPAQPSWKLCGFLLLTPLSHLLGVS